MNLSKAFMMLITPHATKRARERIDWLSESKADVVQQELAGMLP